MTIFLDVKNFTEDLNEPWRPCKVCAHYWPECEMIFDRGGWYCNVCHKWRFNKDRLDEWKPRLKDRPE
jgi:hypothetical protein